MFDLPDLAETPLPDYILILKIFLACFLLFFSITVFVGYCADCWFVIGVMDAQQAETLRNKAFLLLMDILLFNIVVQLLIFKLLLLIFGVNRFPVFRHIVEECLTVFSTGDLVLFEDDGWIFGFIFRVIIEKCGSVPIFVSISFINLLMVVSGESFSYIFIDNGGYI